MGVVSTSGMSGFAEVLEGGEIESILDYIKSTWPEPVHKVQTERSQGTGAADRGPALWDQANTAATA